MKYSLDEALCQAPRARVTIKLENELHVKARHKFYPLVRMRSHIAYRALSSLMDACYDFTEDYYAQRVQEENNK